MFRHIRSKLIAALAVPLAILVAVAGIEAVSSLGQINSVDQETALASASVGPGGIVQALQTEREFAVLSIFEAAANNLTPALQGLNPQSGGLYQSASRVIAETNSALTSFETTVDHAGPVAKKTYSSAFSALQGLPAARASWASVKSGSGRVGNYENLTDDTYSDYTTIVDALIDATAQVPLRITDPTLRTGVEALYASLQNTESEWQTLDDLYQASWSTGSQQTADVYTASQDWGTSLAWAQQLSSFGKGAYAKAVSTLDSGMSLGVESESAIAAALQLDLGLFQDIQDNSAPPLSSVLEAFTEPAPGVPANSTETSQALGNSQIAAIVDARANTLHNNAIEQAALFSAIGAIAIILGFMLVILVSRSISRPLVDLANQAEELANKTLPATVQAILDGGAVGTDAAAVPKVQVHSRDEVSDMARALEDVNRTAVSLAAGQAALRRNLADAFVNLGRRNQNLVTRQLEYISEIELKEANPESLEELFRLDHLATRMRRNAESLLILAGSGPARQWAAAVPAMDVARAASAEVEDYKRLRLHHFDQAQITGAVTTDLVHIMAELTENALTFSPPGSPVDIYGRFLEGGYVIVIVDSGIGMSAEDLETANRRLEGEGADGEVPGRYLGHFVAGRLAARHGIAISLQASHSGGLVARVKIPATLIEDPVPDLSAGAEVAQAADAMVQDIAVLADTEPVVVAAEAIAEPAAPAGAGSVFDHGAGPDYAGRPGYGTSPHDGTAQTATDLNGSSGGGLTRRLSSPGPETGETQGGANVHGTEWGTTTSQSPLDDVAGPAVGYDASSYDPSSYDPSSGTAGDEAPADSFTAYRGSNGAGSDASGAASADFDAVVPEPVAQGYEAAALLGEEPASYSAEGYGTGTTPDEGFATAPGQDLARDWGISHGSDLAATAAPKARATSPADNVSTSPADNVVAHPAPPTPDLGALSPLAAQPAPVASSAGSWNDLPVPEPSQEVGPAAQARTTADGLRRLTRRVPGASLPQEDDSLRRATPASTSRNPIGLAGALSQYLSATATDGRAEKEQNSR